MITKIDQKYKGCRRIERRLLIPKKQKTKYPEDYVHRKKVDIKGLHVWRWGHIPYHSPLNYIY
jgi:hypothetical protein